MPWIQDELPLDWPLMPCVPCTQGKHCHCNGLGWDYNNKEFVSPCSCAECKLDG